MILYFVIAGYGFALLVFTYDVSVNEHLWIGMQLYRKSLRVKQWRFVRSPVSMRMRFRNWLDYHLWLARCKGKKRSGKETAGFVS